MRLLRRLLRDPQYTEADAAEDLGLSVELLRSLYGDVIEDYRAIDDGGQIRTRVRELALRGLTAPDIARILAIPEALVTGHYRIEYEAGYAAANLAVADSLYTLALSGEVRAMTYWLDRRGWKPDSVQEDAPQEVTITIGGRRLSGEGSTLTLGDEG